MAKENLVILFNKILYKEENVLDVRKDNIVIPIIKQGKNPDLYLNYRLILQSSVKNYGND